MNLLQTYLKTCCLAFIGIQVAYAQSPQTGSVNFNKKVKLVNSETGKTVVLKVKDKSFLHRQTTPISVSEPLDFSNSSILKEEPQSQILLASTDNSYPQTLALKDKITKPKNDELKSEFKSNCLYTIDGQEKEQKGFGLQLAAFNQVKFAQDFAKKITKNESIDTSKIYIQSIKDLNQVMIYRVVYGMFDKMNLAQEAQKNIETLGIQSFIKKF